MALNGWAQVGTGFMAPAHMIEHTLSAHHDVAHGAGLAVVNPAWMRYATRKRTGRFTQYAERIFELRPRNEDSLDCALVGVGRFEAVLCAIGGPTRLSENGIDDALLARYAEDTLIVANDGQGNLPGRPSMTKDDIVAALRTVL